MPRIDIQNMYRVDIVESERGWGQKIDESIYFDNADEAREYVYTYNLTHNPLGPVPDWYMVAQYVGKVK